MEQKELNKEIEELKAKITKLEYQIMVEKKGNPFNVKDGDMAYYNDSSYVASHYDLWSEHSLDEHIPCKNKNIVIARQKRHRLNDLLEKFAYDNDAVVTDEMLKDKTIQKWFIIVENFNFEENPFYECERYGVCCCFKSHYLGTSCFATEEVAKRAIEEVIIPFNEGRL